MINIMGSYPNGLFVSSCANILVWHALLVHILTANLPLHMQSHMNKGVSVVYIVGTYANGLGF